MEHWKITLKTGEIINDKRCMDIYCSNDYLAFYEITQIDETIEFGNTFLFWSYGRVKKTIKRDKREMIYVIPINNVDKAELVKN